MKKILLASLAASTILFAAGHDADANMINEFDPKSVEHVVVEMNLLDENGDKKVGEVVAINTNYGVALFPNMSGLGEGGMHGFHVHVNPDCGATEKGLAMKAGGHWDPADTKKHSFAWDDEGHKGDLPALYVDKNGVANYPVLAPKIKNIDELKGHSIMVHVGGDNHSDNPKALGGGGARMVCGVIK
ncbi:superoxide dismutase family protein [Campylobacter corcagiensis]|uniref:Superoxide dismutase [Cu-Zn] n=1 Tax=Campylobacter corcagiensis TaxID=1448857 RepID=A0A7M1LFH6_9BACT|nr:superoxide dismutase family protein [Campylobacter corcagiensis]QKF64755.1 superoxide dismutase (Cu-Zn) [Campylobacter corcagiensis]QOQ87081.1 superoxide dismutase family protein [Campylobacter corcagiensis]